VTETDVFHAVDRVSRFSSRSAYYFEYVESMIESSWLRWMRWAELIG